MHYWQDKALRLRDYFLLKAGECKDVDKTHLTSETLERILTLEKGYLELSGQFRGLNAEFFLREKPQRVKLFKIKSWKGITIISLETGLGKLKKIKCTWSLLIMLFPKINYGESLVLGAGAGRLSFDLFDRFDCKYMISTDINPLLFTIAGHILKRQSDVELSEIVMSPKKK